MRLLEIIGRMRDNRSKTMKKKRIYMIALGYVILKGHASMAMLQNIMKIRYKTACEAAEWMVKCGFIAPFNEKHAWETIMTLEEYSKTFWCLLCTKGRGVKKYERELFFLIGNAMYRKKAVLE